MMRMMLFSLSLLRYLIFVNRVFNKAWQAKLDAKRAAEMEAEKSVKAKAAEEMSNWMTQRDIRLRTKKVGNAGF